MEFLTAANLEGSCLKVGVDSTSRTATVWNVRSEERLLILPSLDLCLPVVAEQPSGPELRSIEVAKDTLRLSYEHDYWQCDTVLHVDETGVKIRSEVAFTKDCHLSRLSLLPTATQLNFYDLVNFRNRHYTATTWPELLMGGAGCETDTYSGDWQFAPHPSLLMLRKNDTILGLGSLDLSTSYGLYFKASQFTLDHLYLCYGGDDHGQKMKFGERFTAPEITLFLRPNSNPCTAMASFSQQLVDTGRIPDPSRKQRHGWHRESVYCSWMDQGYLAGEYVPDELGEQQLLKATPVQAECTDGFVRHILDTIEREDLPLRSFIIDDGWQVARGQWDADSVRFPDLRATVDEIHRRGMKAVVWWSWAEIFDDADIDPRHLAGGGWRNKHGHRVRDYSDPLVQEEYLAPLFHKLFSSDPGCYNFDGVKTDFLADKVHPEMPLHDPAWRGEENYCFRLFGLFYELMKQHKPDGCHIGCAGHPYLAASIDVNRTYDVATSNVREHANRAEMLFASVPGADVAFDLHNYLERFQEYFETAQAMGCSVHIGNILGMKRDRFSPWEPADAKFNAVLKQGLCDLE